MNSALTFLVSRSIANNVVERLRRLRQPKYLAGTIIGAAYFIFLISRVAPATNSPGMRTIRGMLASISVDVASLALLLTVIVYAWLTPGARAAINFSEAEIAWLFPAPVARRTLLHFKLFTAQLNQLLVALLLTLLSGRFARGWSGCLSAAGLWFILGTLQMHRLGASFEVQRLTEIGMATAQRRVIVASVLPILMVASWLWLRFGVIATMPTLGSDLHDWVMWTSSVLASGPIHLLLWPLAQIVGPYFSSDLSGFLQALPTAIGIMGLHYLWVIRADIAFEEASIKYSGERAATLTARNANRGMQRPAATKARTPLFTLRSRGIPMIAFAWKHTLAIGGRRSIGWRLGLAATALIATTIGAFTSLSLVVAAVAVGLAAICYAMILMHHALVGTLELRQDLLLAEVIKTLPLPGWQIVLGQMLGPAIACTFWQWIAVALCVAGNATLSIKSASPHLQHVVMLVITLAAPLLSFGLMLGPIASTLLFSHWLRPGPYVTTGMDAAGLRFLAALIQTLALALALLPPLIVAGVVWAIVIAMHVDASIAILMAAVMIAMTLAGEIVLCIRWLGYLLERFDPSKAS